MPDPSMIHAECSAVLFDSDGVLVDSHAAIRSTIRTWSLQHGLDDEAVYARSHGRRSIDLIRDVTPHLDAEAEDVLFEELEVAGTSAVVAMAGARELLETPGLTWAVVTSGSRRLVTARLDAAGLPRPDVLVSAETVTAGKPAPDGYRAAAEGLGVDPTHCVVVEDADAGVEAGLAAGCWVLGFGPHVTIEHPRVTHVDDLRTVVLRTSPGASVSVARS